MNGKLELPKKPVRHVVAGVPVFREIQPCHHDFPVLSAADIELRAVDIQLLEPEMQDGMRRQGGQHARQAQGLAPLGIKQLHIGEFERGDHAGRVRRNGANAHGYPQYLRGLGFQLRTKLTDSRHNQPVQCPPGRQKDKPRSQQQPKQPARHGRHCFQQG